jgi:hypothetical protein
MKLKEQALAKTDATEVRLRRYQPHDHLLAFLKSSDNADKLARNCPDPAPSRRPLGIIGSRQRCYVHYADVWIMPTRASRGGGDRGVGIIRVPPGR